MKHGRGLAKVLVILLIALASTIAASQSGSPRAQQPVSADRINPAAISTPHDLFPAGVGSYWIYKGVVRSQGSDNKVVEKKVRWRMSVERVLRRDGATAVILKGFPDDLDWSEGAPLAKESMFVRTDDGRVYRFEWETGNPEQQFADTHVPTQELLDQADLMFQWPPVVGAQPGGGTCPERTDEMYCWVLVDAPSKASLHGIKGIKPGSYTAYSLAYRTLPDHTIIEIIPGVGVTAYNYSHHGTVDDVDLGLVEVHLMQEK